MRSYWLTVIQLFLHSLYRDIQYKNRNPSSRRSLWNSHARSARMMASPPSASTCFTWSLPGRALRSTCDSRRSWKTGLTSLHQS
jgi:hypothetical protein